MLEDVPNLAFTIGYTNASWTLKADLTSEYVCRLLNHMDERGYDVCVPHNDDPSITAEPLIDLASGYVQRSIDQMPKRGSKQPWRLRQNYAVDIVNLRHGQIEDGVMRFSRAGRRRRAARAGRADRGRLTGADPHPRPDHRRVARIRARPPRAPAALVRADRHRPDEPELPRDLRRRRRRRRDRGGQAGLRRRDQPRHRRGHGRLLPRDRLLREPGRAARRLGARLPPGGLRLGRGLVHAGARGRGGRGAGRPDRGLLGGPGAPGPGRAGADPRAGAERPGPEHRRLAEPAQPADPGAADPALARLPRALRRLGHRRARRGHGALRAVDRRLVRGPPAAAGPGARRLPAGQPAVRRGQLHRGRLADGECGARRCPTCRTSWAPA